MGLFRIRTWFFTNTSSANKRGTRFRNGDRPDQSTFEDLITSTLMKSEASDRAKEDGSSQTLADMNGHVVAATDAQAKANESKKTDRTLVAQPSQLPTVIAVDNLNIVSNNNPYNNATVAVSIGSNTTRNDFQTSFSVTFKTWLTGLVTWLDTFKLTFDNLVIDYNITKVQVAQNTADIAALSPGGPPAVVPVGAVTMWLSDAGIPAGYLKCDGLTVSQATYPNLFAVLGTKYNTGGEAPGTFRLPNMKNRTPRGFESTGVIGQANTPQVRGMFFGSDSVILNAQQMAPHTHGVNITTDSKLGIIKTPFFVAPHNDRGGDSSLFSIDTPVDNNLNHNHSVVGDTAANTTSNLPVQIINPVFLLDFIIKT